MSKSHAIADYTSKPANTLGLVGVMKTFYADPATGQLSEKYIADLRYVGSHQLVDSSSTAPDITDQESYMNYVAWLADSIAFDGFVATDSSEGGVNSIPAGSFYGDAALHDALAALCSSGDKIMEDYYNRKTQTAKERAKAKKNKQKA